MSGFLHAYSNSNDPKYHLEHLRDEADQIRDIFDGAKYNGFLSSKSIRSIKQLSEEIEMRLDDLIFFCFSGHASEGSILIDVEETSNQTVLQWLKCCKKLRLVFINGCYSINLGTQILETIPHVKIVIGTNNKVKDVDAKWFFEKFSHHFINHKRTIKESFEKANVFLQNNENIAKKNGSQRGPVYYDDVEKCEYILLQNSANDANVNAYDWRIDNFLIDDGLRDFRKLSKSTKEKKLLIIHSNIEFVSDFIDSFERENRLEIAINEWVVVENSSVTKNPIEDLKAASLVCVFLDKVMEKEIKKSQADLFFLRNNSYELLWFDWGLMHKDNFPKSGMEKMHPVYAMKENSSVLFPYCSEIIRSSLVMNKQKTDEEKNALWALLKLDLEKQKKMVEECSFNKPINLIIIEGAIDKKSQNLFIAWFDNYLQHFSEKSIPRIDLDWSNIKSKQDIWGKILDCDPLEIDSYFEKIIKSEEKCFVFKHLDISSGSTTNTESIVKDFIEELHDNKNKYPIGMYKKYFIFSFIVDGITEQEKKIWPLTEDHYDLLFLNYPEINCQDIKKWQIHDVPPYLEPKISNSIKELNDPLDFGQTIQTLGKGFEIEHTQSFINLFKE